MTTTQEIKTVLRTKLDELNARGITREDIAIQRNSEEMDAIQQGSDRALALDSLTRKWETTTLVSDALKRIENGTSGICAECDEQISPKRMAAIPWARYCIHCQDNQDHQVREFHWDRAA